MIEVLHDAMDGKLPEHPSDHTSQKMHDDADVTTLLPDELASAALADDNSSVTTIVHSCSGSSQGSLSQSDTNATWRTIYPQHSVLSGAVGVGDRGGDQLIKHNYENRSEGNTSLSSLHRVRSLGETLAKVRAQATSAATRRLSYAPGKSLEEK